MTVRVRFAPSPTGFMHLGNVRASVLNYLFARQKKGTFILRIEDTDAVRNVEEAEARIIQDLKWLNLSYDEGPFVGGNFGPYLQSERTELYQKQLDTLVEYKKIYRCFCTAEILEEKRKKQLAAGKPPRYDRTCAIISDDKIKAKVAANLPFIWRFKLNELQQFEINDLAKGKVTFDMKHFSDFAITRPDGTFTFIFVNFVDDWFMKITHIIRGEDHLSNTGMQAALYDAFAVKLPTFWHLPIICNQAGEKLSKRDFGFSLEDLKAAGFLPEAISNYLVIIGGSFEQEIQSTNELVKSFNFDHVPSTSSIKYDVDKLTWINHKWIAQLSPEELYLRVEPFLQAAHPASKQMAREKLVVLVNQIKSDLRTLVDVGPQLAFLFNEPEIVTEKLTEIFGPEKTKTALEIIGQNVTKLDESTDFFLESIKTSAQQNSLKTKEIFGPLRYLLTGKTEGIGMHDLFGMLEREVIKKRLGKL